MNEQRAAVTSVEWAELSDALTRGVVHALNNRITAMSAYLQILAMGDDDISPEEVLPPQLLQMEQTTAHLRALCAERRNAEAIEIVPVIQEAVALHAYHPRLRDVRCDVHSASALVPLRVPRWAFARMLLMLIDRAKRAAQHASRDSFMVHLDADERSFRLRIRTDDQESDYARSLAELCGGTIARMGDESVVTLPSLLEVRRLERAAKESGNA
jgi:hypothetical protein